MDCISSVDSRLSIVETRVLVTRPAIEEYLAPATQALALFSVEEKLAWLRHGRMNHDLFQSHRQVRQVCRSIHLASFLFVAARQLSRSPRGGGMLASPAVSNMDELKK